MNNEQDKVADPEVSRAYRDLAREAAPQRLDEAVLDAARRAARPRYARSRAWARPVAWAAVVTLSVAVVLELTRAPETATVPAPAPATVTEDRAEPAAAPGMVMEDRAEPAPAAARRLRQPAALPAEEQKLEPATAELSKTAASPAASEEFERQDKDLLGRADRMAELRSSNSVPPAAAALASEAAGCPEDATRDPETWLECIEDLEEAGLEAAAAAQRQWLREAFPDFELP